MCLIYISILSILHPLPPLFLLVNLFHGDLVKLLPGAAELCVLPQRGTVGVAEHGGEEGLLLLLDRVLILRKHSCKLLLLGSQRTGLLHQLLLPHGLDWDWKAARKWQRLGHGLKVTDLG